MAFGITVDFNADVAKFDKSINKLSGDLTKFSKKTEASFSGARKAVLGFAGAFSAGQFIKGFKSVINEQEKLQKNLLRTEALINSTGRAAGFSADQLHQQARVVAFATLESTEGILKAQQVMLTFKSITGDTFNRAIDLANDLAVTTGVSLVSSVTQVGKALQDPVKGITALSRSGVSFSEQSKKIIKEFSETNQLAKAQKIILDELAGQYGGIAENEAKGLAGAMDTMNQRTEEFKINLGANTGNMDIWRNHVDAMAQSVLVLDQYINGINTGLVAPEISKINNEIVKVKENLRNLKDAGVVESVFKSGIFGESVAGEENKLRVLLKKRSKLLEEINANRAKVNSNNGSLGSIDPPEQTGSKPKSIVSRKTVQVLQDATGPASEWVKLMQEAEIIIESTRSPLENLNSEIDLYSILADRGLINQETLNHALQQAGENYNNLTDDVETVNKKMIVFANQAARNMQDSFAQFLFDPFSEGLDGMLIGFAKVLQQMAAEAAAAQVFDLIKGDEKSVGAAIVNGIFASVKHDGGTVGGAGAGRVVSPLVFAGAQRFHNGGFPGLRSDEVPAILQKGERVLSRKEVAAGSRGGDVINNNIVVNVKSNEGESASRTGQKAAEAMMRAIARQEIQSASRPGNQLNQTTKFA